MKLWKYCLTSQNGRSYFGMKKSITLISLRYTETAPGQGSRASKGQDRPCSNVARLIQRPYHVPYGCTVVYTVRYTTERLMHPHLLGVRSRNLPPRVLDALWLTQHRGVLQVGGLRLLVWSLSNLLSSSYGPRICPRSVRVMSIQVLPTFRSGISLRRSRCTLETPVREKNVLRKLSYACPVPRDMWDVRGTWNPVADCIGKQPGERIVHCAWDLNSMLGR